MTKGKKMSDKIEKKCPFCGGEAELIEGHFTDNTEYFQIVCQKCYSATALYTKKKNAIECWNSRPIEDALKEENRKHREVLTFYAKGEHLGLEDWQTEQVLKDDEVFAESYCETGKLAREALKAEK